VDSKVKEPKDDLISKLVVEQVGMTISDVYALFYDHAFCHSQAL
jgi:antitoxin component of RelBE/YafQ-DinJ toxin-antitoxin module